MTEQVLSPPACQRKNCDGTIVDDEYCDVCGLAPSPKDQVAEALTQNWSQAESSASLPSPTLSQMLNYSSSRTSNQMPSGVSARQSDRNGLGLGLISLPDLPSIEPEKLVLDEPKVPENKRFCGHCDARVRRDHGFCSQCGQRYSFIPSLQAGDRVAEQYEVKGAIAYGGLGWIYLAFDLLLSRYVVLKGLLNSEDESSAAVALAERQFLAAVKHPNIVGVYNFVTHKGEGFIVMEYVAGKTLRDIRQVRGPLPVSEAISYIHRILDAFAYLHQRGLVYCDFKPDNIMREGNDVKLIDMGAVRQIDDHKGDVYGTVGYSAPEAGQEPTVVSDLFTIGRTLAVLVARIPEFSKDYRFSLPGPDQIPLFSQVRVLYQFLLKATAEKPKDRFQSAEEMAEQLRGVLYQVVAREQQRSFRIQSRLFGEDPTPLLKISPEIPLTVISMELPRLRVDETDPSEKLWLEIRSHLEVKETKNLAEVKKLLTTHCPIKHSQAASQANSWQANWYWGLFWLRQKRYHEAYGRLKTVYQKFPGELGTHLGLAVACECLHDWDQAIELYQGIWQTDHQFIAALFGLARCWEAKGNYAYAAALLTQLPASSLLYLYACWEISQILLARVPRPQTETDWQQMASIFQSISPVQIQPAVTQITQKQAQLFVEQSLRILAKSMTGGTRLELVEQANQVRPQTWW